MINTFSSPDITDITDITNITDYAQAQSVNSPPNNSSECSPDTLDLQVPWDIPLECHLSEPVKQQIEACLRSLLQALHNPNLFQAQAQIAHLFHTLPVPNTHSAQITTTKTALSPAAVKDYDTYFGIHHVQAIQPEDTAFLLTHGLLTNCHKFTLLCCHIPTLNPQHIAQQKQGFIAYIILLARVFNIPPLPSSLLSPPF